VSGGSDLAEGVRLHQAGRLGEAEAIYRKTLAAEPEHPEALHLLGVIAHQVGRTDQAIQLIGRALSRMPFMPDAHNHLGSALKAQGKLSAAVASFRRALEFVPTHVPALDNLGSALLRMGDAAGAEAMHRKALAVQPDNPTVLNNLANAVLTQGRHEEAVGLFRRALALKPDFGEILGNLGNALMALGRWAEARATLARGVELRPKDWSAWNNYGNALQAQGQHPEALAAFRKSLEIRPQNAEAHSNVIFTLDLMAEVSGEAALAERKAWAARHAARVPRLPPPANEASPERRLRVGYVSADFRTHSASRIFGPVLCHHDPQNVEIACYSGVTAPDAETADLRARAALWRDTAGLDDEALARQIRADGIDILVDLSGHSGGNRLLAFARKPAPVQVTAWGHALGTGLAEMDAIFLDATVAPPAHEGHFVERVVRLPALMTCELPQDAPDVAPPPLLARGAPSFGVFNRASKITPRALALWGEIVAAKSGARLVLKDGAFDDAEHRARVLAALGAKGVAAERVVFLGASPRPAHLAALAAVDLLLDPLPHGGGISALDALWMGVPSVTLLGARVQGRGVASFLGLLGLESLIARDERSYVSAALGAVEDAAGLAALRRNLRARLAATPLGDPKLYVPAVDAAYRALWRRWCEAQARRA
jgi:predicted O-linked N-acetylglucosamine transferase (SPINDLY family)